MAQSVEQYLAHYRDLILQTMQLFVPSKEPRGYLYDLVASQYARSGKGLRPALCIATCRAYGGNIQQVLQSAVTLEMLHNGFLVHDDIEDGSQYRRDHPTLHTEHGLSIAVNVGDAMHVLGMRPLLENLAILGPELAWRVFLEVEHMLLQSLEGQAMELGWIRDNVCDLTEDDYLRLILKKTCWYTCIHPCRIGALVATAGQADLEVFNRFGYYMGAAFQIQDDILNLVGDRRQYGKEILGDIWEGKRTLMLVHLLHHCRADERDRLRTFLATPRTRRMEREVRWVCDLLRTYGSIDFARLAARHLAEAATQEFDTAYRDVPWSDDKAFIRDMIQYTIARQL